MSAKNKYFSTFSIVVGLILVMVLSVLLWNMFEKNGFHIDELYTYGLSNSNFHPFPWEFDTWLSGEYYRDYLTATENELFNYGSVYYNQTQDVHPPLYYFIIHTVSSFIPGVFTKWVGLSVNLVIHLAVFYLIYVCIHEMLENKWVALSGATFWILSKGAIDSLLFIRMYPLLTLIQVGLLYVTLLFYKRKKANWLLLYVFLLITLGALTHYYFYIYSFLLTLVFCGVSLFEKNIKRVFALGFSALFGIISATIIFPSVFTHVTESNRGQEVLEGFDSNLTSGGNLFFKFIQTDIFRNFPSVLLTIVGAALVVMVLSKLIKNMSVIRKYKQKITTDLKILTIIFLPVLIYIFIVQQVSFYQTPRYIFAVYPMLVIALFIVLYKFCLFLLKNKKQVTLFLGTFSVLTLLFGLTTQESDYKFEESVPMDAQVENIGNQHLLVIMDKYWKISNYVADLKDFNQIYPVEIQKSLSEDLPDDKKLHSLDKLLVLYNKNDNLPVNNLEETLVNKYDYDTIEIVSDTNNYMLYELMR